MKKCQRLPEPTALAAYRQAQPFGTWDAMRNDPFHGGQEAYRDIKTTLVRGQRCLCAYCETRIADGTDDQTIDVKRHEQRVEHFHSKEDQSGPVNWALDWSNLWAVCHGGSQRPPDGFPANPNRYLPPLPENLSCDAFKDYQIKTGKLSLDPEGWILVPSEVPPFPVLFQFAPDGTPEPDPRNCAEQAFTENRHPDTTTLVRQTIEHLNLGCPRLKRSRRICKAQLEKQIENARRQAPGVPPQDVLLTLARRLFSLRAGSPWPEFFTLIRWRLGHAAEVHLQAIQFAG